MSGASRRNPLAWIGPLVSLFGLVSYFTFFVRWPALRDVPWANLGILALGVGASLVGLQRAWPRGGWRRWGSTAGLALSSGMAALLVWYCFSWSYSLPGPEGALEVGATLPAVVLIDDSGRPVDLSDAARDKLVLVFYRGHW